MEGAVAPNLQVQVDSWAKNHKGVHELAEAVSLCLSGFRGTMGSGGTSRFVSACLQEGMTELFDPGVNDYRVSQDFSLWYN